MTDHQQAAIEAARTAWDAHFFGPTRNEFDEITCAECGYAFGWDGLGKGPRGDRALNHAFDQALAAAEPHLRKKWAEEVRALSIGDPGNIEDCLRHEPEVCDLCRGREQAAKLLEGPGNE